MSVMGFFSSRWSERHETPKSEKNVAGSPLKAKWFTLSRGKANISLPTPARLDGEASPRRSTSSFSESSTSPRVMLPASAMSSPALSRPSTDAVTLTLAQRLNELATANADGLLDDNEYRLLRQNIFERFGASSQLPSEGTAIKMAGVNSRGHAREPSSGTRKADSNFNVSRSASIKSSTTQTSTMTATVGNLIRRATGRKPPSISIPDTAVSARPSSTYSRNAPPATPTRTLLHSVSSISLRGGRGDGGGGTSSMHDSKSISKSISSRKTGRSAITFTDELSRSNSRSTKTPPSSFHRRNLLDDTSSAGGSGSGDHVEKTAAQWREEIANVEAEGRRLLDAFNGLELSALTKHRPGPPTARAQALMAQRMGAVEDASWTMIPSDRKRNGLPTPGLARKNSYSSSLRHPPSPPPPLPPLPDVHLTVSPSLPRHLQLHASPSASSALHPSSPSGTSKSSHSPNSNSQLDEDDMDPELSALQVEMANIRARRMDVTERYEKRLELLRAKLKSAEIRERLLK